MNNSGVSSNGQECVIIDISGDTIMPIPESSTSPATMNLARDSTGKAGNNMNIYMNSISPERAKQIKEEVLEMQKKRFQTTSARKRKSTSEEHSDLKNKTSPKKCAKTSANLSKMPKLCPNNKVDMFHKTAPESDTQTSGEDKHKKVNVETLSARDIAVPAYFNKNVSERSSSVIHVNKDSVTPNGVTPSESKNIIFVDLVDDDDDEFQKSGKKPSTAEDKACEIINRLSINKASQTEAAQKVHNSNVKTSKYFGGSAVTLNLSVKSNESKVNVPYNEKEQLVQPSNNSGNILYETSNKAVNGKLAERVSKVQLNQLCEASSNEKSSNTASNNKFAGSSNYNNGSDVISPILTSQTKKFKPSEKSNNVDSSNIFAGGSNYNNGSYVISPTLTSQTKKFKPSEKSNNVDSSKTFAGGSNYNNGSYVASSTLTSQTKKFKPSEKSNNVDSSNIFAGCSNYTNGSNVTSLNLTPQKNGKEQPKLQTKGSIFSDNFLNDTVKLSPKISQQPNKFAVSSSSSKNGLQLVMAAGGSDKKKSPRKNRLGKNSPIKVFRSPYSKKLKSLHADKQKVRKSLSFEDHEEETPANGFVSYAENYLQCFVRIIVEVLDNNLNKNLVRDELGTIEAFMQLEEEAKKLYIRMLGRKFKWHRVSEINYQEITSVRETFGKLENAGFVRSGFEDESLEDMLILLKKHELKELCKTLKIKAVGNKPGLIKSLTEYGNNQMSVGVDSTATILWKSGLAQLGYCIKLCDTHRDVFQRLLTLFAITHQDDAADRELSKMLSLMHFVESNKIVYPSYKIMRTRPVFASRNDMFDYEIAELLLNDVWASVESKDWEGVCSLGVEAQKCFRELLQDDEKSESAEQLPLFLRRYSAGSVYAKAITKAVEGFKKNKATVQDAVIALRELLSQHIYSPHYRGRWYDVLALLLHSHLHKAKETAEVIVEALNDDAVSEEFQHTLSVRGSRLLKVLKGNCADLKAKLKDSLKQPLDNIPEVTIKAKALSSNLPGYKKVYIEEDTGETTFSSVEELVISRYKKEFPEAIHGEGSTVCTLFAILFWDIIYHQEVPDVFQSPYQIEPLDMLSGEFYANRKEAIDNRLQHINEWSTEEFQWVVKEIYKQHEGKNSLVNWNRFRNVNQILNLIKCIGAKVLSRILERFAKHYKHVRKGFPDLLLWAPARNECLFVEVKGPKDRLSVCQKIWLNKLIEFGARAEVCHVQTTGSKTLKRKTSEAPAEKNQSNVHNKEAEKECIELSE